VERLPVETIGTTQNYLRLDPFFKNILPPVASTQQMIDSSSLLDPELPGHTRTPDRDPRRPSIKKRKSEESPLFPLERDLLLKSM
jgi:hypothetical protein